MLPLLLIVVAPSIQPLFQEITQQYHFRFTMRVSITVRPLHQFRFVMCYHKLLIQRILRRPLAARLAKLSLRLLSQQRLPSDHQILMIFCLVIANIVRLL